MLYEVITILIIIPTVFSISENLNLVLPTKIIYFFKKKANFNLKIFLMSEKFFNNNILANLTHNPTLGQTQAADNLFRITSYNVCYTKLLRDFSGAIGTFSLKMSQSADTVNINDAVSIKLTLSGTGNFNMIEIPEIIWPKEFEVYEPVASENTTVSRITSYNVCYTKLLRPLFH